MILKQDELSILKRQNVSRSLSFGSLTMEDRRLAQENSCAGITCEVDMAQADEMLEKKSKDTIRMSIKQVFPFKSIVYKIYGKYFLRCEQEGSTLDNL